MAKYGYDYEMAYVTSYNATRWCRSVGRAGNDSDR